MNAIKEVADYIRTHRNLGSSQIIMNKNEAHLILNALEKQIPKKVKHIKVEEHWDCPICGNHYSYYDKPEYCKCGQKLDWNI